MGARAGVAGGRRKGASSTLAARPHALPCKSTSLAICLPADRLRCCSPSPGHSLGSTTPSSAASLAKRSMTGLPSRGCGRGQARVDLNQ